MILNSVFQRDLVTKMNLHNLLKGGLLCGTDFRTEAEGFVSRMKYFENITWETRGYLLNGNQCLKNRFWNRSRRFCFQNEIFRVLGKFAGIF